MIGSLMSLIELHAAATRTVADAARGNAPSEARETSPKASPKGAKRSREAEAAMRNPIVAI